MNTPGVMRENNSKEYQQNSTGLKENEILQAGECASQMAPS
jgi:hypothetical protein